MAKVRLKSTEYEIAAYDGDLVGIYDSVFGKVVPRTCPAWFPAVSEEVETLQGVAVEDGKFIEVAGEGLFFGEAGKWRKLEPGDRVLCDAAGQLSVVTAEAFVTEFEPL